MAELCISSTATSTPQQPNLLLSCFFLLWSLILSHPLYSLYLLFFLPYLLQLLSFLSPLFLTTSILLLAHLPPPPLGPHHGPTPEFSGPNVGALLLGALAQSLRPESGAGNEQLGSFEESQVYRIVFDISALELAVSNSVETRSTASAEEFLTYVLSPTSESVEEEQRQVAVRKESEGIVGHVNEEKDLESFFQEPDRFEAMAGRNVDDEKKVKPPPCTRPDKVVGELQKGEPLTTRNEPKVDASSTKTNNKDTSVTTDTNSSPKKLDSNMGRMRREKEWRKTLACKLFEERHGGEEGMDSLWETYETRSCATMSRTENGKADIWKKSKNTNKNGGNGFRYEEYDGNGQLCCLRALKLSTGKMNLGMGRPNLMRISKALKGIGWLHHVTNHGKKR